VFTSSCRFEFGEFAFDSGTGTLRRRDAAVPLPAKATALLFLLLQRSGDTVSKREILDALWPAKDVTEANIAQYVFLLRAALQDDARQPTFVATEYGGGYRFVAPLRRVGPSVERTVSPLAGDIALLEARYLMERRQVGQLRTARKMFRACLRADPKDIRALIGLAEASSLLGSHLGASPHVAFAAARRLACEALRRDEGLARARSVLAHVALFYEHNLSKARECGEAALAMDRADSLALSVLARVALVAGDLSEATRVLRRQLDIAPASLDALTTLAVVSHYSGETDRAVAQLERIAQLEGTFSLARYYLGCYLVETGRIMDGVQMLREVLDTDRTPHVLCALAYAYARAGQCSRARELLLEVAASARRGSASAYMKAAVLVGLGDRNGAVETLERGWQGDAWAIFSWVEPRFEALRRIRRFRTLRSVVLAA
jgi:DNA-binding winged helix-turn-helix (wHTH) protein/predicted Zn-dependent protease